MASQEELNREEELRKASSERAKLANDIRSLASEQLVFTREILSTLREQSRALGDISGKGQDLIDQRRALNSIATKVNRVAQESVDLTSRNILLLETEKDVQKQIEKSKETQRRLETESIAAASQVKILEERNLQIQKEAAEAAKKNQDERFNDLVKEEEANNKIIASLTKVGGALNDLVSDVKNFRENAEKAKENFIEISKLEPIQVLKGLEQTFSKVPLLGDIFSEASKKAQEDLKEARAGRQEIFEELQKRISAGGTGLTEEFLKDSGINLDVVKDKGGNLLKGKFAADQLRGKSVDEVLPDPTIFANSFKTAFKAIGPAIKSVLGPLFIIKELVDILNTVDKETVELQKSFAASGFEAASIRTELALAAAESGNINITTSKLLANITALSKEFGFVAKFSSDTLITMTKLTEQVGLTAQEAAQLAAAAEISDKSFEDIYQNVLGASYELQQQAGVQFDLREILKDVNSVTGQVRANLSANPEAIAKAVTEAKLFGAELDDIVSSSKALLQFEDSIRNELQAELLLGRDLNLERARSAALLGDQETLAKELAAQAQDFTSFTKLNVLQQDALASSLGMQSDQLADILFKQEVQNKTARQLRDAGKEELAQRLEQQTLADKFNATIEKLKGIFTDVATALLPLLRGLGAVLSLAGAIVGLVGDLINLFKGDFDFSGFRKGLQGVGGSLGLSMEDGIIPPKGEGSVIQSPRGTFKLPPEDTIIAGTDLFGATPLSQMPDYNQVINDTKLVNPQIRQTTTSTQTVKQNFDTFVSRLDKVEAAINNQTKVLAKGQETIAKTKTKLQVGATDFGTELNVNSFRIQ